MKKYIFILGLCSIIFSCSKESKSLDVRDFGAIGDSLRVNTVAIQKAIDFANTRGGGVVEVNNGIYISGTLLLKDNVTLLINEDAKLVGSSNPRDYQSIDTFVDATGQERGTCLIGAKGATNIGITGKGVIDGNGTAFKYDKLQAKAKELGISKKDMKKLGANRPFLLRFVKSTEIRLKDIHLRQPAAWTCHFYQSNSIEVDNVDIFSHAHQNNDGIDMDSSHDIIIKNCNIDAGDDAICFKTTSPKSTYNIKVSDCTLKSEWGAIKFGTESMGDFYDIDISNCKIHDTRGGGIKILSVDGANIKDISISDIEMDKVDMPIFVRLGERLRTYRKAPKQDVGSINKVLIRNVTATTQDLTTSRVKYPSGIFITGTPNHKVGGITLENIKISLPGGGKALGLTEVEEAVDKYPEFSFFKTLPAYGLFGRHIDSLKTQDITFDIIASDEREERVLQDVEFFSN